MPNGHACILASSVSCVLGAEYWASQGGMQQAHALLERMRLTKVPSEPYVEAATVEAIYKVRCVWHGSSINYIMQLCHMAESSVLLLCSAAGVSFAWQVCCCKSAYIWLHCLCWNAALTFSGWRFECK